MTEKNGYHKYITDSEIGEQRAYCAKVRAWNEQYRLAHGAQRRYHVETFGCQQNEADSERLAGMLVDMGYVKANGVADADLILINTCAVREHAELKALSITGQYKHLKAQNPELLIGICGCMVSQEHRKDDIKKKYPYVNFSFGTSLLYRLPEILFQTIDQEKRQFYLDDSDGNIAEGLPVRRESGTKAWVSIMYGCNNFCTYCVVPYVRGRERSRASEDILKECRDLVDDGYKELTLLGQNVNSYGKDRDGECDFPDLLLKICQIDGDFTVRFMTSHPKDASFRLIDTIASEKKIANQLHLPLQSGSDRVLKAMNRRYTTERYAELVDYMRSKIPDIILSTDIIVGFPSETEEDFTQTLAMLQRIQFDMIYSFIYSPRKGTPAAEMPQLEDEVKGERFRRMLELQNEISFEKNQSYVGQTLRVLVDGISKNDAKMYSGRTEGNKIVHFPATELDKGQYREIKIDRAETFSLFGTIQGKD